MNRILYIDIETIPGQDAALLAEVAASVSPPANMSKPETIAKWEAEQKPGIVQERLLKTALDGAIGQVAVIGWAFNDEPPSAIATADYTSLAAEAEMLRRFFARVSEGVAGQGYATVVGHNVARFDLRFLYHRAVIHGIRPPAAIKWHAKPWDPLIGDTMVMWTGDAREFIGLDKLCRILGVQKKGEELGGEEIDGSKVWEFVRTGRIAEVATYCAGDVHRAREVYKRLTFADQQPPAGDRPYPKAVEAVSVPSEGPPKTLAGVMAAIEFADDEAQAEAALKAAHGVLTPEDYAKATEAFNAIYALEG